jgi:hypothetical protein
VSRKYLTQWTLFWRWNYLVYLSCLACGSSNFQCQDIKLALVVLTKGSNILIGSSAWSVCDTNLLYLPEPFSGGFGHVKPMLTDIVLNDSLMDGAYDKEEVFKFLKEKAVAMPGIKIRKNAIVKAGSERAESVLELLRVRRQQPR